MKNPLSLSSALLGKLCIPVSGLILLLVMLFSGRVALAEDASAQQVQKKLSVLVPSITIENVQKTPIDDVFMVELSTGEIVYSTSAANSVITGDLIYFENQEMKNFTVEHRAAAGQQLLTSIPERELVVFPSDLKEKKAEIFVFTDSSCGYCRKLHQEVPELNQAGIQVNYLAWPRAGLNSEPGADMVSVWCAKDRQDAMDKVKSGSRLPAASCKHPISKHLELGQKLGVRGTPAIFLKSGEQVGGYVPAKQLIKQLITQ